jgi:ubiquitin carboxyl-terminal hydrolase MINDY-1/2
LPAPFPEADLRLSLVCSQALAQQLQAEEDARAQEMYAKREQARAERQRKAEEEAAKREAKALKKKPSCVIM